MANITIRLHGIDFEWDDFKALANRQKHNVAFELGCEIFFDPFIQVVKSKVIDGELRESAIGLTSIWRLLYVEYALRQEAIRIISVRPVTRQEQVIYENG